MVDHGERFGTGPTAVSHIANNGLMEIGLPPEIYVTNDTVRSQHRNDRVWKALLLATYVVYGPDKEMTCKGHADVRLVGKCKMVTAWQAMEGKNCE